jgi:hypothetical protein
VHDREREAGVDSSAVEQNRASAALAVITAFLCPRQVQVFAECIEQRRAWIQFHVQLSPVHLQFYGRYVDIKSLHHVFHADSLRAGNGLFFCSCRKEYSFL